MNSSLEEQISQLKDVINALEEKLLSANAEASLLKVQHVNSAIKISHLQKKVNFLSAHSDALSKMLESTYLSVS